MRLSSVRKFDDKYYQHSKVIMLPTVNKHSGNVLWIDSLFSVLQYNECDYYDSIYHKRVKLQHLYVIDNSDIKEGDWVVCLDEVDPTVLNWDIGQAVFKYVGGNCNSCKKLVATTDEEIRIESTVRESDFMSLDYGKVLFIMPKPSNEFIINFIFQYGRDHSNVKDYLLEYEWWYEDAIGRHTFMDKSLEWLTIPDKETIDFYDKRIYLKLKVDQFNLISYKTKRKYYLKSEVVEILEKCRDYCKDGWKDDSSHRVFDDFDNWVDEIL